MLTSSSLLTGQIVANPESMPLTNPLIVFIEEVTAHYRRSLGMVGDGTGEEDVPPGPRPKVDMGQLPVKFCVLRVPDKNGKQMLGGDEVSTLPVFFCFFLDSYNNSLLTFKL